MLVPRAGIWGSNMRQQQLQRRLARLAEPRFLARPLDEAALQARHEAVGLIAEAASSARAAVELASVAAMHPDPWIRRGVLRLVACFVPGDQQVVDAIKWLTHDSDDFVAFEAIRLAGDLRLRQALPELLVIVGSAARRLGGNAGKPVGIGHALVLDAIVKIVGTDDPAALRAAEAEFFEGTASPIGAAPSPPRARRVAGNGHSHEGMRYIPRGEVTLGVPPTLAAAGLTFDWADVQEPRTFAVAGFWMDAYQVSAAQYDAFAESEQAFRHACCHPSERPHKPHPRNTLFEARFGGTQPAAGIDWFDAYAFATWTGKRLPTEMEWQRAAQGDEGQAYPWGERYERDRVRLFDAVVGRSLSELAEWRQELLAASRDTHRPFTVSVDGPAHGASPFGIVGLSGNTWEWTDTNFLSFGPMAPEVGRRDVLEVVYDWRSYAVIRGGAWSSLPELATSAFRGKDLLTDRHYEIGLRCVCDCPGPGQAARQPGEA